MWRPKNWKNPYESESLVHENGSPVDIEPYEAGAYEAGADAMLDAIWNEGIPIADIGPRSNLKPLYSKFKAEDSSGRVVFIHANAIMEEAESET